MKQEPEARQGVPNFAYVKPVVHEDKAAYAICAIDGTQIAILGSYEEAFIMARHYDLHPVSAH